MNSLILLSSLIFQAASFAITNSEPPKVSNWEKMLNARFELKDREEIVKLATHLPKMFPINFLCEFKSAAKDAKPLTVFPGESVDAPEGGTVNCPGLHAVNLDKGTHLRLMQASGLPRFVLEQGKLTFTFVKEAFFVDTPSVSAGIVGEGTQQILDVTAKADEQKFYCPQGALAMELVKKPAPGNPMLETLDCRMSVKSNNWKGKRYLVANESVAAWNLVFAHQYWPNTRKPGEPPPKVYTQLALGPQKSKEKVSVSWFRFEYVVAGMPPDLDCTVFGQKGESELAELMKFTEKGYNGTFELDSSVHGDSISAVCESPTVTHVSSRLDIPTNLDQATPPPQK